MCKLDPSYSFVLLPAIHETAFLQPLQHRRSPQSSNDELILNFSFLFQVSEWIELATRWQKGQFEFLFQLQLVFLATQEGHSVCTDGLWVSRLSRKEGKRKETSKTAVTEGMGVWDQVQQLLINFAILRKKASSYGTCTPMHTYCNAAASIMTMLPLIRLVRHYLSK